MKNSIVFSIFFSIYTLNSLFAQTDSSTLSPSVLASGGGYGAAASANLSWTVGETVVFTSSPTPNLTQGFHQQRVKCEEVDSTLFSSGSVICEGTNALATISNAVTGINYRAYFNAKQIGKKGIGKGKDLNLILPHEDLKIGVNVVYVKVQRYGCSEITMPDTAWVRKVKSLGKMPPISYTGTLICVPITVYLFAKPDLKSYQWTLNDTLIRNAVASLYKAPVPGSHKVMAFVDGGCLSESDSLLLTGADFTSPAPPQIKNPDVLLCSSDPVNLALINSGVGFKYRWRYNSILISGANQPSFRAVLPGSYTVQIQDENGCSNLSEKFQLDFSSAGILPKIALTDSLLISDISNSDYEYQWYAAWDSVKRAIVNAKQPFYKPQYNAKYYVSVNRDSCLRLSPAFIVEESTFSSLQRMGFETTDSTIRIPSQQNPSDLLVSPIPANDILIVNHLCSKPSIVRVHIYDAQGIPYYADYKPTSINYNAAISVKNMPSGFYFLVLQEETQTFTKKLVIE
ncbi:MAG: T9SS type A sorting domain-containing protein [Cytophagales bacterium]